MHTAVWLTSGFRVNRCTADGFSGMTTYRMSASRAKTLEQQPPNISSTVPTGPMAAMSRRPNVAADEVCELPERHEHSHPTVLSPSALQPYVHVSTPTSLAR